MQMESNTFILLRKQERANQAIARKIIVKTGKSQGDLIEILEGLKDGNSIIKKEQEASKMGKSVYNKTITAMSTNKKVKNLNFHH
jgi:hypothetical protein